MRHENTPAFVYGMLLRAATEPATLADHRLVLYGHATIEPAPGEFVPGGLIENPNLDHLDSIEGHLEDGSGYYTRKLVKVDTPSDEIEAWVYVMHPRFAYGLPSASYVQGIADGYRRLGFDPAELDERVEVLMRIAMLADR